MSDLAYLNNLNNLSFHSNVLKSIYSGKPAEAVATHKDAPTLAGSILDAMLEAVDAIQGNYRPQRKDQTMDIVLADTLSRFGGYHIVKAQVYPKMQLAEDVTVSPEFRDEMNTWMRQFFGVTCLVERGNCLFLEGQKTIVVHPVDYETLQLDARQSRPFSCGLMDWGW